MGSSSGSLSMSIPAFLSGIFSGGNEMVDVVIDLRFPRIIIALLAGAALSVSGLLLQAVMRNPLADAGVIGISAELNFLVLLSFYFYQNCIFGCHFFLLLGSTCLFSSLFV